MEYDNWLNKNVSVIYHTGQNQQGIVSYISDEMIILGGDRMIPMSNICLIKKIKE